MSAPFDPVVTFTRLTRKGGLLSKVIRPDGKGGIVKEPAAAMTAGTAETVALPFSEFGAYLRSAIKPEQALAHGVTGHDRINILSAARFTGQTDTICRTKEFFRYPHGWGVGMLDHDPKPGQDALTVEQLIEAVSAVWPEFADLPKVVTGSTSAYIFDPTGKPLSGRGSGFHCYFPIKPAAALPTLAEVLFKRLWLTGHGYIAISRAGSMLVRTIFDAAVFSPERIDFCAGAKCTDCEQRLLAPDYHPGRLQEDAEVPLPRALTPTEEAAFNALTAVAKEQTRPESEEIRAARMEQEVEVLREERGIDPETAEAVVKARHEGRLEPGDFIQFQGGTVVTVAEIHAEPQKYHGQPCADPLEPEYGTGKAMLYANASGSVIIHSFLHGGQNFMLRQPGGDADAHSEQQPEAMTAEECRATGDFTLAIPTEIANPGGLISLGVSALTQPGLSPIVQFAMPAVLAHIATAIRGRLAFRGVYPSTFNARVGPTSTGKSQGDKVLSAAIRQTKGLSGFYGPTEFASGPALLRALADRPRCLILIDEATSLFRRYGKADMIADGKRDALLEVTTKAGGVLDKAYANSRDAIKIESPCVNILGNCTPTVFEAIGNEDFYTGLLQRVDFWTYDGPALKRERPTGNDNAELDGFVSGIAAIFNARLVEGDVADDTGAVRELGITADADKRLFEWSHETTDKANAQEDDGMRGIISRSYDAAIKYAIVHCVGTREIEHVTEPLTMGNIEYGISCAWMLADWKLTRLRDRVTTGDFDRDCELFKEAIRRAVGIGRRPTLAMLVNRVRALKNFTEQYFEQVVGTLAAREEVIVDDARKPPAYYLPRR